MKDLVETVAGLFVLLVIFIALIRAGIFLLPILFGILGAVIGGTTIQEARGIIASAFSGIALGAVIEALLPSLAWFFGLMSVLAIITYLLHKMKSSEIL